MNSLPILNSSGIVSGTTAALTARNSPFPAQRQAEDRLVERRDRPAITGFVDSDAQRRLPAMNGGHQHRHERDRQQRRTRHRKRLGERQRPEHPPFLRLSRKTGTNDTMMIASEKKTGGQPAGRRPMAIARRGPRQRCRVSSVEMSVGVLDHDDRRIDQHANRQREAAERHDVRDSRRGNTSG